MDTDEEKEDAMLEHFFPQETRVRYKKQKTLDEPLKLFASSDYHNPSRLNPFVYDR